MKNIPDKIIVHHSAFEQAGDQLMQINQWHKERDFPLSSRNFYVGYHFVINHEGQITQTRELDEVGAHTKGFNFESIGICLEGDFTSKQPNDAQKKALGDLLVMLCDRLRIDGADIYPHRTYSTTSCYGDLLSDKWASDLYTETRARTNYNISPCEQLKTSLKAFLA